ARGAALSRHGSHGPRDRGASGHLTANGGDARGIGAPQALGEEPRRGRLPLPRGHARRLRWVIGSAWWSAARLEGGTRRADITSDSRSQGTPAYPVVPASWPRWRRSAWASFTWMSTATP